VGALVRAVPGLRPAVTAAATASPAFRTVPQAPQEKDWPGWKPETSNWAPHWVQA
jgi:hypothetical protein